MANLVTPECGGANPLMRLAQKFQDANTFQNELGLHHMKNDLQSFAPDTFDMQELLTGMRSMENFEKQHVPVNESVRIASDQWSEEYFQSTKPLVTHSKDTISESFHDLSEQFSHGLSAQQFHPMPRNWLLPQHPQMMVKSHEGKWAADYLDEVDENLTADEILTTAEKKIEEKTQVTVGEWLQEYNSDRKYEDITTVLDNTKTKENEEEYWEKLQAEWNDLFRQEQFLNEEEAYSRLENQEYTFEKDNPFSDVKNCFEEGLKHQKKGDLISAILCFEEAVKVDPEHAEAWQYLGTSQAENEQEMLAVRALNKCVELDPENLTARMSLAVSYTNESMQLQACDSLKDWIKHNPRYSHMFIETSKDRPAVTSSLVSMDALKEVERMFLSAARIAPQGDIDADIQIGLGVLFNISGDYNKAIDCFKTGLQARSDSADLYNKLGATLANSGRSAEAIEAYRHALNLRPGFIRCRYNLGISCVNLKAYQQAAEHFLTSLNMQRQGKTFSRVASTMSESIWSTLRMTVSLLGRMDLLEVIEKRDLNAFNKLFQGNS